METNKITPRIAPDDIQYLGPNDIFVFGSNLLGRHGAGAADLAFRKYGAIMGLGIGPAGKTFAIPTKGVYIETLPIEQVKYYVDFFIQMAQKYPKKDFLVTKIGCGLAGFSVAEIAPLFTDALRIRNIYLPKDFWNYLTQE
jgi:hypothetical protein